MAKRVRQKSFVERFRKSLVKTQKQLHSQFKSIVQNQMQAFGIGQPLPALQDAKRIKRTMSQFNTEAAYSYGQLTKNLAGQILNSGNNISPEIVAAAQEAYSGRGDVPEQQLLEVLRGAYNIQRSGATTVNKVAGGVKGAFRTGAQLGMLASTAGQGGLGGAAASGQLLQMAFEKADDLTKNKFVKLVATKLGEAAGGDSLAGGTALYAISRGLALAGAITGGAVIAAMGAKSYLDNQTRIGTAQRQALDAAWSSQLIATPAMARKERLREEAQASGAASSWERFTASIGFGGALEEAKAKAVTQNAATISLGRQFAGALGVNVAGILGAVASKKGKRIDQLNDYERAEALNGAVVAGLSAVRSSASASNYARTQMLLNDEAAGVFTQVGMWLGSSRFRYNQQQLTNRYRDEYARRVIDRARTENERREYEVQKYRASLSREQNLAIENKIREGQFKLAARRQRHKVNWND